MENNGTRIEFADVLRSAFQAGILSADQIRAFACACCRRISHLLSTDLERRVMEFAERRASGDFSKAELAALRTEYSYTPEPEDFDAPSSNTVANTAIGEAAFTEDPVNAAVGAAGTAADAVGTAAGEKADPREFDIFYDPAYFAEAQAQLELFREMFPNVRI